MLVTPHVRRPSRPVQRNASAIPKDATLEVTGRLSGVTRVFEPTGSALQDIRRPTLRQKMMRSCRCWRTRTRRLYPTNRSRSDHSRSVSRRSCHRRCSTRPRQPRDTGSATQGAQHHSRRCRCIRQYHHRSWRADVRDGRLRAIASNDCALSVTSALSAYCCINASCSRSQVSKAFFFAARSYQHTSETQRRA